MHDIHDEHAGGDAIMCVPGPLHALSLRKPLRSLDSIQLAPDGLLRWASSLAATRLKLPQWQLPHTPQLCRAYRVQNHKDQVWNCFC
jgi:hypothetical protein